MTEPAPDAAPPSTVATAAQDSEEERVAALLDELRAAADALRGLDLSGIEPDIPFDPSWSGEGDRE